MTDTLFSNVDDPVGIPVGTHCILELYDCPSHLLDDRSFIQQTLREAALHAESTLLDEVAYQFTPHGVTALALLAESHISVHTWPERGYLAADVFTCGQHTKPEQACQHLLESFKAGSHAFFKLPRGRFSPDVRHLQTKTLTTQYLVTAGSARSRQDLRS